MQQLVPLFEGKWNFPQFVLFVHIGKWNFPQVCSFCVSREREFPTFCSFSVHACVWMYVCACMWVCVCAYIHVCVYTCVRLDRCVFIQVLLDWQTICAGRLPWSVTLLLFFTFRAICLEQGVYIQIRQWWKGHLCGKNGGLSIQLYNKPHC